MFFCVCLYDYTAMMCINLSLSTKVLAFDYVDFFLTLINWLFAAHKAK